MQSNMNVALNFFHSKEKLKILRMESHLVRNGGKSIKRTENNTHACEREKSHAMIYYNKKRKKSHLNIARIAIVSEKERREVMWKHCVTNLFMKRHTTFRKMRKAKRRKISYLIRMYTNKFGFSPREVKCCHTHRVWENKTKNK